jgi:hypothetical protein
MEYLGLAETKSVPRCPDLHHPRATVKFFQAGGRQRRPFRQLIGPLSYAVTFAWRA